MSGRRERKYFVSVTQHDLDYGGNALAAFDKPNAYAPFRSRNRMPSPIHAFTITILDIPVSIGVALVPRGVHVSPAFKGRAVMIVDSR